MMPTDTGTPVVGCMHAGRQSQKKRYDQHAKHHVAAYLNNLKLSVRKPGPNWFVLTS